MSGDQAASLIAGIMCLVLVGSNLIVRRLALGQTIKLALVWAAIFAVILFGVSLLQSDDEEQFTTVPDPHRQFAALHNVDYRVI